ncbi:cap methyltransferase 1 isoform X2 [Lasioglossum baleicum]|uniref:cap methyltransferase 1 isoform X2 n=1 Tax=Lasioglossum baleicum TaxID=434251 RepID=UPI003FCD6692
MSNENFTKFSATMKNYSDDSVDNEDDDSEISDKKTMEEKEMYQSISQRKRKRMYSNGAPAEESSDSNDGDYNENYCEHSDEKNDPQSSSHSTHQDLSCEQDSVGECSSQNLQSRHTDDTPFIPNKRRRLSESSPVEVKTYKNSTAERMMQKMGYREGCGLGKYTQGRLEPVEAAKQHGRRGFGHHIPGLEASSDKFDPSEEESLVIETMKWIKNPRTNIPTFDEMKSWLKKGPKKLVIDDETEFCDEDIVRNIINSKTIFDKLDDTELRRARTRSNPYETIRGAMFLNRAAVKMANIDRACNFMFTKPTGLQDDELLHFADVCAGPGGFSEYVLYRKKWHAKGFGFTLKNENDFKLADFYAGPCETFHPYYGPSEDGNVFDPANQEAFREIIMQHTNDKGVHFMMSDGGFSVEGQENIQEILSKQLYLCQCLVALMIVKDHGHFVTKLFDVFTPFSAGLVYLMYCCFDEVCIFKPNTSRPANSERYLICKHKRPNTDAVVRYFKYINNILLKNDENNDVTHLVPLEELEKESLFLQYLRESNNYLGKKQITGLQKIAAFCEDTTLIEPNQAILREECLKYWDIPDESRTMPKRMKPQDKLRSLLLDSTFLSKNPKVLTKETISAISQQPHSYYWVPCATKNDDENNATFYLGLGRSEVYRYTKGNWVIVRDNRIEIPADTILYAEQLYEMTKQHRNQRKLCTLHIIDVLVLGGENVSEKCLLERHKLAKKFCRALWKPNGSHSGYTRIRTKDLFPLNSDIGEKLRAEARIMKNGQQALTYELRDIDLDSECSDEKPYFIICCILFLKAYAEPWSINVSKSYRKLYVYNSLTKASKFLEDKPPEADASFSSTFANRIVWHWPKDQKFSKEELIEHISDKLLK